MSEFPDMRAGFVGLMGASNVGKSTLLNRLVGTKVSIVSPKVQTTRRRVIGITIDDNAQIAFVDTPGIFLARGRRLERAMVEAAWSAASDADLVVVVVDARRVLDANTRNVIEAIEKSGKPRILAINKIDLMSPQQLLPLIKGANDLLAFEETFLVSALTGNGCEDLLHSIAKRLPEGPWLYPEDQLSDLSNRALAAEITREKLFNELEQELPYSVTIETEQWAESPDGKEVRIDQTIYVMRDSQKAIVIGKGGRQLRAIGEAARKGLEQILDAHVQLFLFVKVRKNWMDDPERFRELGLDFPD